MEKDCFPHSELSLCLHFYFSVLGSLLLSLLQYFFPSTALPGFPALQYGGKTGLSGFLKDLCWLGDVIRRDNPRSTSSLKLLQPGSLNATKTRVNSWVKDKVRYLLEIIQHVICMSVYQLWVWCMEECKMCCGDVVWRKHKMKPNTRLNGNGTIKTTHTIIKCHRFLIKNESIPQCAKRDSMPD